MSLLPTPNLPALPDNVGKFYLDQICPKRFTNEQNYNLINNINDEETFVNFTLWTGTKGEFGLIEILYDDDEKINKSALKFYADSTKVLQFFLVRK
jgi:hypothetical protein